MAIVKIQIQGSTNRKAILLALAESGYKTWQEVVAEYTNLAKYFVCFEHPVEKEED